MGWPDSRTGRGGAMIYRLMLALLLLSCGEGWANDTSAPVLVNREMFLKLVQEAERQGRKLAVTLVPDIQRDRFGNALPSPCHKRMKEAMVEMDKSIQLESNPTDKKQPVWMIPEILKPSNWNRTMNDCVK